MKHKGGTATITFVVFDTGRVVDLQRQSIQAPPGGKLNLNGKEIDLAQCR